MKKYISLETILDAFNDSGVLGIQIQKIIMERAIANPDVIELVRCNNCRHLQEGRYCKNFRADNINADGFCNYGKDK